MSNPENFISIIVPVYNSELFLERCISSILKQTYTHYEVILIDDGSTDNSPQLCGDLANKYTNFHSYHLKIQVLVFPMPEMLALRMRKGNI